MTKNDILLELPNLKPEERHEIWDKLAELDEQGDDAVMTEEQREILRSRIDDFERHPEQMLTLEEMDLFLTGLIAN